MLHIVKTDDSIYLGEIPEKDMKYYGKIFYSNGTSYQGYFINGEKNGYGEEKIINGVKEVVNKTIAIDNPSALRARATFGLSIQLPMKLMFAP
jgi:hypothetical protein